TFGKVIGGGLPLAAYAGKRDLMKRIAPSGPVYQAGTLSGNPLAVAAGHAALSELAVDVDCAYERLEAIGSRLQTGIEEAARRRGIPVRVQRQGSMLGLFFTTIADTPVTNLDDVHRTDRQRFTRVFHRLLADGIHLPPSAYEALFLSTAHGDTEIDATVEAFDRALSKE
ncbi:MAG TPA: aminotransferase class III-fold pyridoxal phosphate-dependent enzyme, partial [Thermoanaerobaculia bacterium]|nr:aminotransferase class III-fold pyridoxal phosphate-dependent enzyme [Thermoanaerobaculia bacterium]